MNCIEVLHLLYTGGADTASSDENLTDTETEASSQNSSPIKHLSGHHRLPRIQRTGHSNHGEGLQFGDVGFPSAHLQSLPSPPPRVDLADEESRSSMSAADIDQIRDVLITATEDLGPMGAKALQTTDQDQGKLFFILYELFKGYCVVMRIKISFSLLLSLYYKKTKQMKMSFYATVLLLVDTHLSSHNLLMYHSSSTVMSNA